MTKQIAALFLVGASALIAAFSSAAQQADPNSYSPQAPPEAYQAALRANIKIVRDWIDMNDYQSAAQSQRLLGSLAQLYALRSNDDKHKQQAAAVRAACDKVAAPLRAKNAEASKKALADCEQVVAAMTKTPPADLAVHKNYKTFGNTNTWMMMIDCSVVDADEAKSKEEFQHLALAVAEVANALQFLRNEARWRTFAGETRSVALKAVSAAKQDGLDAGKIEMKKITKTCEACHQGYRR